MKKRHICVSLLFSLLLPVCIPSYVPGASAEPTQSEEPSEPPTDPKPTFPANEEEAPEADLAIVARVNNDLPCEQLITKSFPFGSVPCKIFLAKEGGPVIFRNHLFRADWDAEIECLRHLDNGNYYIVYDVEEGGRVFKFFDSDYCETHGVYVNRPGKESDYDKLRVGDSIQKVFALDRGSCLYNSAGLNQAALDGAWTSLHLLENTLILIQYKEDEVNHTCTITKIEKFPDKKIFLPVGTSLGNLPIGTSVEYSVTIYGIIGEGEEVFDFTILPQDYPKWDDNDNPPRDIPEWVRDLKDGKGGGNPALIWGVAAASAAAAVAAVLIIRKRRRS